jgi:hypothetical protein
MDPQVALTRFDSTGFFGYRILATGENTPGSTDAMLVYTGLTPGERYLLMVDGVNGSEGEFCIEISDEPLLSATEGICQIFPQPSTTNTAADDWINLYANSGPNTNGPLLAAIQTSDNLGAIVISTEIHPTAPVLGNGQKILPRYFNIETEFQPQNPVKLRLFFTEADLLSFNITPPEDSVTVPELGITHYDGGSEDCDPQNNTTGGADLPVSSAVYQFAGQNGIFYLETSVSQFSEFGAAFNKTSGTGQPGVPGEIRVFPVPAGDRITLEATVPADNLLDINIRNSTGQTVSTSLWKVDSGRNSRTIDLSNQPPGIYLATLIDRNGKQTTLRIVRR